MLVAESSIVTSAREEDIWRVWSDVSNWSQWDPDVRRCEMHGAFQRGAEAVLTPASGPSVNVEIIECIANQVFVSRSALPCSTFLVFEHRMNRTSEGLVVTHRVELTDGCMGFIFNFFLGDSIRAGLPVALNNLSQKAVAITK